MVDFLHNFEFFENNIINLVAWIGGDNVIFNERNISVYLPYPVNDIKNFLENLCYRGFLLKSTNHENNLTYYSLSLRGAYLLNYGLAETISRWAYKSQFYYDRDYLTIQHGFLVYSKNMNLLDLFKSIRNYPTQYFSTILEKILYEFKDAPLKYLEKFRTLLIRICIYPNLNFVTSGIISLRQVLDDLILKKIFIVTNEERIIFISRDFLTKKNFNEINRREPNGREEKEKR